MSVVSSMSLTLFAVTLNDHNLYEYLMSDELYMGVLGTLECEDYEMVKPPSNKPPQTTRNIQLSKPRIESTSKTPRNTRRSSPSEKRG